MVELLFLTDQLVLDRHHFVLGFGESRLDVHVLSFQHHLLNHVFTGDAVELAIELDIGLGGLRGALRLQDRVVGALDFIDERLFGCAQLRARNLARHFLLFDLKFYAV